MPLIRLLCQVVGPGPVTGDVGDEIRVDGPTAKEWADGLRAELVRGETRERAVTGPSEMTSRPRRVSRKS